MYIQVTECKVGPFVRRIGCSEIMVSVNMLTQHTRLVCSLLVYIYANWLIWVADCHR